MPVVDTRQFKNLPKTRHKKSKKKWVVIVAAALLTGYITVTLKTSRPKTQVANTQPSAEAQEASLASAALKTFDGEAFKTLAKGVKYPNTEFLEEPPFITGNKIADERIQDIAQSRGFVLTGVPVAPIRKIDEPRLDLMGDDLLQPLAAEAWSGLKVAAKQAKVPLSLLSAYRSPEYQRTLFLSRLSTSPESIANGSADKAVERTLLMTAPPGYSRHHTGYTIDLWCEDGSGAFVNSKCFRWLKKNNYQVAKEHGWIPSYPEGVMLQGPEPEPWEYVWVGTARVRE